MTNDDIFKGKKIKRSRKSFQAGVTFDNSFFDNSFVFLRQFKNMSFLGIFTVHKKVEIRINQN